MLEVVECDNKSYIQVWENNASNRNITTTVTVGDLDLHQIIFPDANLDAAFESALTNAYLLPLLEMDKLILLFKGIEEFL